MNRCRVRGFISIACLAGKVSTLLKSNNISDRQTDEVVVFCSMGFGVR